MRWTVEDDDGSHHSFLIPDSHWVPNLPHRLLSPQHWARVYEGAYVVTNSQHNKLFWDGYTLTVPIDHVRKVPLFQLVAMPSVLPAEEQSNEDQMTVWHRRLGHVSGNKLRSLAVKGVIPSHLKDAHLPTCRSCLLAKAQRKAWRTKGKKEQTIAPRECKVAGDIVSMDHLQSFIPGFVGQSTGRLTMSRYVGAVFFVDHFSDMSFVHLVKDMTVESTIKAREAFVRFCGQHGVKLSHMHADNGRFADATFVASV